jgi:hypothetical protein
VISATLLVGALLTYALITRSMAGEGHTRTQMEVWREDEASLRANGEKSDSYTAGRGKFASLAKGGFGLVSGSNFDHAQREASRRRTRYLFTATAELIGPKADTRTFTQVRDLSLYGCCIDIRDPLPEGADLFVKIFTSSDFLKPTPG